MIAAQGFGNGVHVHFSLQDLTGAPVSHDPSQPAGVAAQAGSFVAGIMRRLPALTAFTAPSPVSYLRLAPGHWAGGAAAFGADLRLATGRRRSASVRAGTGPVASTRASTTSSFAPPMPPPRPISRWPSWSTPDSKAYARACRLRL